ncbi:MAG: hypothetical protein AAFN93_20435, partial [Bacteroidota bacterium]
IKGNLKPNSTYIVEVRPVLGAVKAALRLNPISPDSEKPLKRIRKMIAKKAPKELKGKGDDMSTVIKNGMNKLNGLERDIKVIESDWTF